MKKNEAKQAPLCVAQERTGVLTPIANLPVKERKVFESVRTEALSPETEARRLATLAKHERWQIRMHVARHPSVTEKTLRALATDEDPFVSDIAKNILGKRGCSL